MMLLFALLPGLSTGAASVDGAVRILGENLHRLDGDPDGVGVAVCVARAEQILMLEARGVRRLGSAPLVNPDTRFRIASLSKGFASTVTAQLVSEGLLDWSSPVADSVSYFTLKDPAEARRTQLDHVLSHRMGMPHNAYDKLLEAGQPVERIVRQFKKVDPICPVGTCYGYQNIGFNLVAEVIESSVGEGFEGQVRDRLFKPLGMNQAGFGQRDLVSSGNWAQPHIGRAHRLRGAPVKENYYRLPASAGINASILDMCQWLRAQLGGKPEVVPTATLELLWTPQVETRRELYRGRWRRERLNGAHYGYGWRIYDYRGERVIFHAGSVQGYGAQIVVVPRLNVGVVALWNSQSRRPWGIAPTFLDALLGIRAENWMRLDGMVPAGATAPPPAK